MIRVIALSLVVAGCADLVGIRETTSEIELSTLQVQGAMLVPAFDPEIHSYVISMTYSHPMVEVTASAPDPTVAIEVAGAATPQGIRTSVAVPIGVSTIDVVARTTSGVETVYTISAMRSDFRLELVEGPPAQATGMTMRAQIADLDSDGAADIVYQQQPGSPSGGVGVLLNNGAGAFDAGWYLPITNLRGVDVGDVMGDAAIDMVITDGSLLLLRGRGDGTFDTPFPRGLADASALTTGRLDLDTRDDLAVADGGGRVTAFFNDTATMVYGPVWQPSTVQFEPRKIAIANVDTQPGPDVVTLDGTMNTIVVSSMSAPATPLYIPLPAAAAPREMVVVDVDGDGRSEIVWLDPIIGTLNVQQASATQVRTAIPLGGWAYGLAAGDVDGNGAVDLALIQNDTIVLLRNDTHGAFSVLRFPFLAAGATSIAIGDIDGDGFDDLVLPRATSSIGVIYARVP